MVTDDLGRKLVLSAPPRRIVSLEPSVTEILYAVGAQNKIVADDNYADFPDNAKLKPHVNGLEPSREVMAALHPDIIFLYDQTFTRSKADMWQQEYGVPVYVLAAGTYAGIEDDIRKVGALVGDANLTKQTVESMISAYVAVSKAVCTKPKVKVFVVIWDRPLMTAGRGTYLDDLIKIAGGTDVASSTAIGYPTYSPERLIGDSPEYILTGTLGYKVIRQSDPELASLHLDADRHSRSFAIPDDWTSRPGPRLALGLTAIAHVLHAEAFQR